MELKLLKKEPQQNYSIIKTQVFLMYFMIMVLVISVGYCNSSCNLVEISLATVGDFPSTEKRVKMF